MRLYIIFDEKLLSLLIISHSIDKNNLKKYHTSITHQLIHSHLKIHNLQYAACTKSCPHWSKVSFSFLAKTSYTNEPKDRPSSLDGRKCHDSRRLRAHTI